MTGKYFDSNGTFTAYNSTMFNNKQPIFDISPEILSAFIYIVNIILTPIVGVIGLTGNIIGLYLLRIESVRRPLTFNIYLKALLLVDSSYLALGIIAAIVDVVNLLQDNGNFLAAHFEFYKIYFDTCLSVLSVCMVIVLSMERLASLLWPFTVKKIFLSRHPLIVVVIAFITSTGVYSFLPLSTTVMISPNSENMTEYMIGIKPGYQTLVDWFTVVTFTISYNILPVLVLVLNISIIIFFSRYTTKLSTHVRSNKTKDYQSKITIIVVCVAGLYIVLSVPNIFVQVLILLDDDYKIDGKFKLFFFFFLHLGDFLLRINAAADFYIYMAVAQNFRSGLKGICCTCHESKPERQSSYVASIEHSYVKTTTSGI